MSKEYNVWDSFCYCSVWEYNLALHTLAGIIIWSNSYIYNSKIDMFNAICGIKLLYG